MRLVFLGFRPYLLHPLAGLLADAAHKRRRVSLAFGDAFQLALPLGRQFRAAQLLNDKTD
ncbi:hypothetical protein D3C78_1791780 [compost metagenome]